MNKFQTLPSKDFFLDTEAKNGTGKTGAYTIPIIDQIDTSQDVIQGNKI